MPSPAPPEAALPQLDPIIGGTLALLTLYARTPCLSASDRIACNLALIARHPQASADLQALCTGLFADWLGPVEPQDALTGREWRDVWPMPPATQ
jgi:hypothetical protein